MFRVGDRVIIIGEFPIWSVTNINYSKNKITIVRFWDGQKNFRTLDLDWASDKNLRIASKTEIAQRDIKAIILNKERDKVEAETKLNSVKRNFKERPKIDNWDSWKRDMFNDMSHELPEPIRKKKEEEKPKEVKPLKRSIEF